MLLCCCGSCGMRSDVMLCNVAKDCAGSCCVELLWCMLLCAAACCVMFDSVLCCGALNYGELCYAELCRAMSSC